jgi:hypothetical protein
MTEISLQDIRGQLTHQTSDFRQARRMQQRRGWVGDKDQGAFVTPARAPTWRQTTPRVTAMSPVSTPHREYCNQLTRTSRVQCSPTVTSPANPCHWLGRRQHSRVSLVLGRILVTWSKKGAWHIEWRISGRGCSQGEAPRCWYQALSTAKS